MKKVEIETGSETRGEIQDQSGPSDVSSSCNFDALPFTVNEITSNISEKYPATRKMRTTRGLEIIEERDEAQDVFPYENNIVSEFNSGEIFDNSSKFDESSEEGMENNNSLFDESVNFNSFSIEKSISLKIKEMPTGESAPSNLIGLLRPEAEGSSFNLEVQEDDDDDNNCDHTERKTVVQEDDDDDNNCDHTEPKTVVQEDDDDDNNCDYTDPKTVVQSKYSRSMKPIGLVRPVAAVSPFSLKVNENDNDDNYDHTEPKTVMESTVSGTSDSVLRQGSDMEQTCVKLAWCEPRYYPTTSQNQTEQIQRNSPVQLLTKARVSDNSSNDAFTRAKFTDHQNLFYSKNNACKTVYHLKEGTSGKQRQEVTLRTYLLSQEIQEDSDSDTQYYTAQSVPFEPLEDENDMEFELLTESGAASYPCES
ncbi:probable ATP-dependent helicase PF08_0048 [Ruditapes philippinarum]|uniref:probable ATP-dependent helicase PF08_0048 n=1 Tax=Ruditapes philippinarum TaxID=129788 RepID=UPI00295AB9A8|nr:probable ATP-dependent helicase PF08_0048 [Ruditapes philippinarum]